MYPIPIFSILTDSGVVPIPEGSVKRLVVSSYIPASTNLYSCALLLDDGRLFIQGDNYYGEVGDGTTTARKATFNLANTGVANVFALPGCFAVKYNNGGWQWIGDSYAFLGGTHTTTKVWTSFPSSITGTLALANVANISGGEGNCLWEMTNSALYGSGNNNQGCLGPGNSSPLSIPRLISNVSLGSRPGYNTTAYVNNVGNLRSAGFTQLITGSGAQYLSYTSANFATWISEGVYVRGFMGFADSSILFGAPTAADSKTYLYQRQISATGYSKFTTGIWANGFDTWSIPKGQHNTFFIADGKLYAFGGVRATAGIDTVAQTVTVPTTPTLIESTWVVADIDYIETIAPSTNTSASGNFLVYRGNLYYTGNIQGLFNGAGIVGTFTNVPESSFTGTTATNLSTDSIGIAIVGGTKQLTYQVSPLGAPIYQEKYTTSDATKMTVSATGLMTFVAEGGFDAGMSAINNLGETLSDSSGGYASTLSVYTDSLSAMDVGTTQQLVATISPSGAATIPGMVVTYTTTDPEVATVSSTGLISGVADGDCRIGCTATYQGTVVASDSSYLAVNAVAPAKPVPFDSTDYELVVGPGRLYLSGGLATTAYSVDWGNGSAVQAHTTSGGIIYKDYTGAATARWTVKISIPEANLIKNQHGFSGAALIEVKKWPTKVITGVSFYATGGCTSLTTVPTYLPPAWTSLASMFQGCTSFNQDVSMWDVTNITNMSGMFNGAESFSQPLRWWDTRSVTDMSSMFIGAKSFNHAINDWNTVSVKTMQSMFSGTGCIFNQPIGNWNLSALTNMRYMFQANVSFNQDISAWKPTKVTASYRQNWDSGTSTSWTADKKPTFTA